MRAAAMPCVLPRCPASALPPVRLLSPHLSSAASFSAKLGPPSSSTSRIFLVSLLMASLQRDGVHRDWSGRVKGAGKGSSPTCRRARFARCLQEPLPFGSAAPAPGRPLAAPALQVCPRRRHQVGLVRRAARGRAAGGEDDAGARERGGVEERAQVAAIKPQLRHRRQLHLGRGRRAVHGSEGRAGAAPGAVKARGVGWRLVGGGGLLRAGALHVWECHSCSAAAARALGVFQPVGKEGFLVCCCPYLFIDGKLGRIRRSVNAAWRLERAGQPRWRAAKRLGPADRQV